ncbi:hypothetical protein [Kitasatospora sp. NPDC059803]|uniref:hypothetical protein n=1 Tax=Kitasatospora sp. NPDC059803 TaxID=3346953 RepID=UPI003648C171
MTTTATVTNTAADQIGAAGALMAILTAHTDLPAPTIQLQQFFEPATDIPVGTWGVKLSLHRSLTAFEQWREALDMDPTSIDSAEYNASRWLSVYGTRHGVPVELIGYYDLPKPAAAREEPAMDTCYFCDESKPDIEVRTDPFTQDVCNEEWIVPICAECYQTRCDDI